MMIIQVPLLNLAITHRSFCLRYRTTLRFDSIHTFLYVNLLFDGLCKNLALIIHRIPDFQDSQLHIHTYTKPNGNQSTHVPEKHNEMNSF